MQVAELQNQVADLLAREPGRAQALADDPAAGVQSLIRDAAKAAYIEDKMVYRIAIVVLGSLALIAALGGVWLVTKDKVMPEAVVALGSASVGALVGLFATPPNAKSE